MFAPRLVGCEDGCFLRDPGVRDGVTAFGNWCKRNYDRRWRDPLMPSLSIRWRSVFG